MNWISHEIRLKGDLVELLPMQEYHFAELDLTAQENRIWEFIPFDMSSTEKRLNVFSKALAEKEKGNQFPFVIYHKKDKRLIGSTRFLEIMPEHKKLEIGWTWLHPDYWASAVNPECKLLLLSNCFENLKANRVQLRTDENNIRSRTAILKTGAQYEGILRNDLIRDNGTFRNSAYFSIIESEWLSAKEKLNTYLFQKSTL